MATTDFPTTGVQGADQFVYDERTGHPNQLTIPQAFKYLLDGADNTFATAPGSGKRIYSASGRAIPSGMKECARTVLHAHQTGTIHDATIDDASLGFVTNCLKYSFCPGSTKNDGAKAKINANLDTMNALNALLYGKKGQLATVWTKDHGGKQLSSKNHLVDAEKLVDKDKFKTLDGDDVIELMIQFIAKCAARMATARPQSPVFGQGDAQADNVAKRLRDLRAKTKSANQQQGKPGAMRSMHADVKRHLTDADKTFQNLFDLTSDREKLFYLYILLFKETPSNMGAYAGSVPTSTLVEYVAGGSNLCSSGRFILDWKAGEIYYTPHYDSYQAVFNATAVAPHIRLLV